MPAPRVAMRRIREVLRLKLLCKLSHREIARALGVSVGAVSHYGQLAEQAGLAWPEVEAIDESQLEARLMPRAPPVGRRVLPDFAAIHQELKRKGVTLQLLWEEYVAAHSGETTYRYTQFCQRYADWAATPPALDAPGPPRRREVLRRLRRADGADPGCRRRHREPSAHLRRGAGGVQLHLRLRHRGRVDGRLARARSVSPWSSTAGCRRCWCPTTPGRSSPKPTATSRSPTARRWTSPRTTPR